MKIEKAGLTIILVALAAVAFFFAGQPIFVVKAGLNSDWPIFHHDAAYTGLTDSTGPAMKPVMLWSHKIGSDVSGSPVITDGYLYINGVSEIFCFNSSTGMMIWNNTGTSSPAFYNGYVYAALGGENQAVFAYESSTGNVKWSHYSDNSYSNNSFSSCSVEDGIVYVGGQHLSAFNASNGILLWTISPGGLPAISNGYLYLGSNTKKGLVYAVNASTGEQVWSSQVTANNTVFGIPMVAGDRLYIGARGTYVSVPNLQIGYNLYCLNASSGSRLWNYTTGSWVTGAPAMFDGYIYVHSDDGILYALNASTGEKIWDFAISAPIPDGPSSGIISSSPAVAAGIVYVGSTDGNIYALNAYSGRQIWNYTVGVPIESSPAIVDGCLYIGASDGSIYALAEGQSASPSPSVPEFSTVFVVTTLLIIVPALLSWFRIGRMGSCT